MNEGMPASGAVRDLLMTQSRDIPRHALLRAVASSTNRLFES